jgi:serine/threonine protein kinase
VSNYLNVNNPNFKTKKMLAYQMLSACKTVNEQNLIHRDIKTENFFVNKDKDGNITSKLADFGLAKTKGDIDSRGGTPYIYSPEYASAERTTIKNLDHEKIDAWALGVALFTLFHPNKQYPNWTNSSASSQNDVIKNLNQDLVDRQCQALPPEIQPLVKDLLQVDPQNRLSAKMALEKYRNIFKSVIIL